MAAINKRDKRLKLEFVANKDQSIHAGLVLVEAISPAIRTLEEDPPDLMSGPTQRQASRLWARSHNWTIDLCPLHREWLPV
jgi:hypothetical protein